jgi:hypothetical protein
MRDLNTLLLLVVELVAVDLTLAEAEALVECLKLQLQRL